MTGKNELRDEEIYKLYLVGKTRGEIGLLYGISKDRVGQIVHEAKKKEERPLHEIYQLVREANPDCDISMYTRVYHAITWEKVFTKADLMEYAKEIESAKHIRIRNVGPKGLEMIQNTIAYYKK